ncbi:MAG: hypothetical protein DHS20C02_12310 [Micavibrio sp.]|nr:MAG: hypothetical protein DHS20C02_12310 [Micavibrio sp.]
MEQENKKPQSPVKFRKMTGDLIGVAVLAMGVAAVIGVGYLAYARFGGGEQEKVDVAATEQHATAPNQNKTVAAKPDSLPSKSKLKTPKERDLAGSWQADFGANKAFLQISEGAFQLIYVRGKSGQTRKYSRGSYTYDADQGVLVLKPNRSLGKPDPVKGVRYKALTMRDYGVTVYKGKRNGALYWKPNVVMQGKKRKMHPLFKLTDREEAAIKWEKSR